MRILIAVDMEGITGVVHGDQATPGHAEYDRFRRLMTEDVNAAVRGVCAAGATEVIVSDGHWDNRNILIELLDARARLNSGSPRPFSMLEGIDLGVAGALFVGYHAQVGTPNAILDHTWSTARVAGLWLNDRAVGEIGLNAAVCGHFGVPVVMISGDQSACAEASTLLGPLAVAVVKRAIGRNAAECLPPAESTRLIERAAARAVEMLVAGQAAAPFRLLTPITVAVEFVRSEMADAACVMPGARRSEGKRVVFVAQDMPEAYRAFRALVGLANV